jgi:hypothetical protein
MYNPATQSGRDSLDRYAKRIETQLETFRSQELDVFAFEIGNEINLMCFNGDISATAPQDREKIASSLDGYAAVLKTAKQVISEHYPSAHVISAGLATPTSEAGGISPTTVIRHLRSMGGVVGNDYLAKYASGCGFHLYLSGKNVDPVNMPGAMARFLDPIRDALDPNMPIWLTEWSSDIFSYLPGAEGSIQELSGEHERYLGFMAFLEVLNSVARWNITQAFNFQYSTQNPANTPHFLYDRSNNYRRYEARFVEDYNY